MRKHFCINKIWQTNFWVVLFLTVSSGLGFSFEDTKVLPKGVRNFTIRNVNANINSTSKNNGQLQALGAPLEKVVNFSQLAATKNGIERSQVEAFLQANNFNLDDEIGQFQADVKASIRAVAPVFAYGITDNWSLGIAVPVYSASSSVALGFRSGESGQKFLNLLADPKNNNVKAARDAAAQMNELTSKLQAKLASNDFEKLEDWKETGLGDVLMVSRYRIFESGAYSALWSQSLSLPTGRTDDPDILNDIPFGLGAFGLGTTIALDQSLLGSPFFLNEYVSYTAVLPTTRKVRLKTKDEIIEVPVKEVSLDPGDKVDVGVSLQGDFDSGWLVGVGGIQQKKFADRFSDADGSEEALEDNTDQDAKILETQLGYSSIKAFKAGKTPVPYTVLGTYRRMVWSRNQPVAHQVQFDLRLFF